MEKELVQEGYGNTAQFYDFVVPYRDRPDVPFFVEQAREMGGPVLELGCGTGRVLIPTARAAIDIVGIDLSPDMLAVCRERVASEPAEVRSRIEIYEADMRAVDLGRSFTLVTTPFRSFQHLLSVDDQMAALDTAFRHLKPGGRFILDVFNPDLRILAIADLKVEYGEEPAFLLPDGRRVIRGHRLVERDLIKQVVVGDLVYKVAFPDGREERVVQRYALRYFFRYEVEHLLARCGFELESVYGGYDRTLFGSTYPGDLICVAAKPDT